MIDEMKGVKTCMAYITQIHALIYDPTERLRCKKAQKNVTRMQSRRRRLISKTSLQLWNNNEGSLIARSRKHEILISLGNFSFLFILFLSFPLPLSFSESLSLSPEYSFPLSLLSVSLSSSQQEITFHQASVVFNSSF